MGNLLYRKNLHIVQQITDEIEQIEHILHEPLMLNITKKNSFVMQKMNNYNQQDIHLFFDTAKYKISKAKKTKKRKEKNETYGKVTLFKMSNTTIRRSRVGYIMNDEKKRKGSI